MSRQLPVILIGNPSPWHSQGLFELGLGFRPPARRREGDTEFDAVGDGIGCKIDGTAQIHQGTLEGGGRELPIDQLSECSQEPIQLDHLSMPDRQHVIANVFVWVQGDRPLCFPPWSPWTVRPCVCHPHKAQACPRRPRDRDGPSSPPGSNGPPCARVAGLRYRAAPASEDP